MLKAGAQIGSHGRVNSGDHLDSGPNNGNVNGHGGRNLSDGQRTDLKLNVAVEGVAKQSGQIHLALEAHTDGSSAVDRQAERETSNGGESGRRVEEHQGTSNIDVDLLSALDEITPGLGDLGFKTAHDLRHLLVLSTVVDKTDFRAQNAEESVQLDSRSLILKDDGLEPIQSNLEYVYFNRYCCIFFTLSKLLNSLDLMEARLGRVMEDKRFQTLSPNLLMESLAFSRSPETPSFSTTSGPKRPSNNCSRFSVRTPIYKQIKGQFNDITSLQNKILESYILYLQEVDRLAEKVQSKVHRGRARNERFGSVDQVGVNIPAGIVNGAEGSQNSVTGILAQIGWEGTIHAKFLNQTTDLLLAGRRVRLDVLQMALDVATDCKKIRIYYRKIRNCIIIFLFFLPWLDCSLLKICWIRSIERVQGQRITP